MGQIKASGQIESISYDTGGVPLVRASEQNHPEPTGYDPCPELFRTNWISIPLVPVSLTFLRWNSLKNRKYLSAVSCEKRCPNAMPAARLLCLSRLLNPHMSIQISVVPALRKEMHAV